MKLNEIVKKYNIDAWKLRKFILEEKIPYEQTKFSGWVISDSIVEDVVKRYREKEESGFVKNDEPDDIFDLSAHCNVVLVELGPKMGKVMTVLYKIKDVGRTEGNRIIKDFIETANPQVVKANVERLEAEEIKNKLENAGAKVVLERTW